MTVSDAPFGQIIRRHLERHAIPRQHPNPVAAQLARQVRQDLLFLVELHTEQAAGELFYHGTSYFNTVFFAHYPPDVIIHAPAGGLRRVFGFNGQADLKGTSTSV